VAYLELNVMCSIEQAIANNERRHRESGSHLEITQQTIRNVHSRMQATQYAPEYSLEIGSALEIDDNCVRNLPSRIAQQAIVPKAIAVRRVDELTQGEKDRLD